MFDPLAALLDGRTYVPHGYCLWWDPWLLTLTAVGNGMVSLAYKIIPLQLIWMFWKAGSAAVVIRGERWVHFMFGTFIALCGLTHDADIAALWFPLYWAAALLDLLTGMASLMTAVMLATAIHIQPYKTRAA